MVLGDNIFYGNGFSKILKAAVEDAEINNRATVFGYYVPDPERFGVVAFDENGQATSIEEKPAEPKSNYAVTCLLYTSCEIWSGEQATIEMLYHKVIIAPWNKICLLYTSLLAEVRGCYDYIIIDTPPVGSVIDAAIIAKESDGAVLVIESERVSYKVAQKSMEQLEKTGCKILGAVLNKVNIEKNKYYGKYDYYYKSK